VYCVLQAEQVSIAQVLDVLIIFVMAAIWAFMPSDGFAVLGQWFYNKVVQVSSGYAVIYAHPL